MATTAQAIELFARMTGLPDAHVGRVARILQLAKDADMKSLDQWPTGKQGGGKSAVHVQPHHLVNLAIALAVADPITTGPGRVLAFRSLVPKQDEGASDFGSVFDALVDFFARPDGMKMRPAFLQHGCRMLLYPTRTPAAVFEHSDGKQTFSPVFIAHTDDPLTPGIRMGARVRGIIRIGSIDFQIIQMMSNLWADSRSSVTAFSESPPLFAGNPFDRASL